jgi:hypothetical protein
MPPGRVLNICGEGEVEGAVNLNNLVAPLRKADDIRNAGEFIEADVLQPWSAEDNSFDMVLGNNLPGFDPRQRGFIAGEAWRVLKPSGYFKVHSMSGKFSEWKATMKTAGFIVLPPQAVGTIGYAVGQKPGERE